MNTVMPWSGHVQAGGRLVQKQDLRRADQRHAQHQPLAQALGQFAALLTGPRFEIEGLQQFGAALLACRLGHAMQFGHQQHVLAHRQVGIDVGLFGHHADVPACRAGRLRHVVAGDDGLPFGGRDVAGEHAGRRALARAVGAEEAEDLAAGDAEADVIDRHAVAEATRQAVGHQGGMRKCGHGLRRLVIHVT